MSNIDKKSILIVDDEEKLASALASILQPLADEILTAENGQVALEMLGKHPNIVAILSDIYMPVMSGLELLANIRKSYNPIPFVVLTAYGDGASFQEAVRLDATDFLAKPIKEDHLTDVMTKAIEYGVQLKEFEYEIDQLILTESVPTEQVETFRRAKRTLFSMRIGSNLYLKKIKAV